MAEAKTTTRKKQRRSVPSGQLHIQATFNNTIVTFTAKMELPTLHKLLLKKQPKPLKHNTVLARLMCL
jgi:hypothetical protein